MFKWFYDLFHTIFLALPRANHLKQQYSEDLFFCLYEYYKDGWLFHTSATFTEFAFVKDP
jgi:hypothetical protein